MLRGSKRMHIDPVVLATVLFGIAAAVLLVTAI
jgi:hypothetical protein